MALRGCVRLILPPLSDRTSVPSLVISSRYTPGSFLSGLLLNFMLCCKCHNVVVKGGVTDRYLPNPGGCSYNPLDYHPVSVNGVLVKLPRIPVKSGISGENELVTNTVQQVDAGTVLVTLPVGDG